MAKTKRCFSVCRRSRIPWPFSVAERAPPCFLHAVGCKIQMLCAGETAMKRASGFYRRYGNDCLESEATLWITKPGSSGTDSQVLAGKIRVRGSITSLRTRQRPSLPSWLARGCWNKRESQFRRCNEQSRELSSAPKFLGRRFAVCAKSVPVLYSSTERKRGQLVYLAVLRICLGEIPLSASSVEHFRHGIIDCPRELLTVM